MSNLSKPCPNCGQVAMEGDCTLPYDICACSVVGGCGFCDGCSMTRCQYECSCDEPMLVQP